MYSLNEISVWPLRKNLQWTLRRRTRAHDDGLLTRFESRECAQLLGALQGWRSHSVRDFDSDTHTWHETREATIFSFLFFGFLKCKCFTSVHCLVYSAYLQQWWVPKYSAVYYPLNMNFRSLKNCNVVRFKIGCK